MAYTTTLASHLYGGELTYKYNGTNYTVQVMLYRNCAQAAMPANISLDVNSVSKNYSYAKNMALHHQEDVAPQCATTNTCVNGTSAIPGYQVYYYIDTVNLPDTASDWVLSTTINSRTAMANLGSGDLYLDAWLNNTIGENDVAYTPPFPPFFLNTSSTVIPLQTLDPEGDSIAIDTVAPRYGTLAAGLYFTGYSVNTPLGANGVYTIDNTYPQTMTIHGGNQGQFALAYRVKEYRNGVMIGAHLRDFVTSIASGNTVTYPQLGNMPSNIFTCPASVTDTARFVVTDPTAADSVYISIDTPTLQGFAFVRGDGKGIPTASAYGTWATPMGLNLNTTPYFYVVANVRDNNCPPAVTRYAVLVNTRQCNVDSVWPGDANNDKVVNLLDPLAVALTYGQTGIVRPMADTSWRAQYAIDWGTNIPNSSYDKKYSDCDGNGIVDNNDLVPISKHWMYTHPKDGPQQKTTALPDLYFDINGVVFAPGMSLSIPIKLGTTAVPMVDFYGLGVRVGVTTAGFAPPTQATISTTPSWLGNSGNTLVFNKNVNNGTIDWAYARNDHQNVTGSGTLAMLNFDIPGNAQDSEMVIFTFRIPVSTDKDGRPIAYNTYDDTGYISVLSVRSLATSIVNTSIVPNPSGSDAQLYLSLLQAQNVQVTITDITGKQLWTAGEQMNKGTQRITLPASSLPAGVYMVRIADEQGVQQTLKWVKQ